MKALTVRRKIQLGVLAIVFALLGAAFLATGAAIEKDDGEGLRALRDAATAFDHFRKTSGEAMYAAVNVATDDGELEVLLQKGDAPAFAKAFERRAVDADKALDLDLLAVVDAAGKVVVAREVSQQIAAQLRDLRIFRDALAGASVPDAIEDLGGEPWQLAAEPFYEPGGVGARTGVMIIGRKLSSLLARHVERTGHDDLVLSIVKEGRILASEAPPATVRTYEDALRDRTGNVARVGGVPHDVVLRDVDSCGGYCSRVVQLVTFRSRSAIETAKSKRMVETAVKFALLALAALGFGWLLARWITRPIERYVAATEALAKGGGDLTQRLSSSTDDELGRLAGNLNDVFAQIARLATEVKGRATEVGHSSEEIRGASHAVLEGAAEQAARLQSTGAATTELSASIQQVASAASDANAIAKRAGEQIEDAVRRMSQIRDAVEKAANRMALLGETGKRIGTIVDTIHQIADQTSLLALNAAIEAAHAGEHGRGFTVVADAVGQLATRVDRSAKEIDELIGQSRAQTEEALAAMADGSREVEAGTGGITESIAAIRKVLVTFDDTTAAVKEQALASDEIARNMDAIGRIAQDVLVSSKQAVAQADRLATIAHALEEVVGGFKTDGEPARAVSPRTGPKLLP